MMNSDSAILTLWLYYPVVLLCYTYPMTILPRCTTLLYLPYDYITLLYYSAILTLWLYYPVVLLCYTSLLYSTVILVCYTTLWQ